MILETVPDAMVVIDEHGRILSFSTAAEQMFGYHRGGAGRREVSTLMPSPDRERHDGISSVSQDRASARSSASAA